MSKDAPILGVHVSISGSIDLAVDRAQALGCNTFQIFTRNPQGWKYGKLADESVDLFRSKMKNSGIKLAVSHMPYLPNLASPDDEIFRKSVDALAEEIRRAELLGLAYVILHLGSHMGKGIDYGQKRVADAISKTHKNSAVTVLLENMAGQKNAVGAALHDIRKIIEHTGMEKGIGVCLDTCHAFAAGYDIASEQGLESFFNEFEREIGSKKLMVIHLNDSKGPLGSHLDRHENIGKGLIGKKGFKLFLARKEVRRLPMILETPVKDEKEYIQDMKTVISLY
ncbi:MAG: deoxyribonuclease IV [Conexivisphaerales archaeon]